MAHEISEFDIPDRQLLAAAVHTRASGWTEIGEAKVVRTMFGGARVRVIREQDQVRRLWLYAMLAAAVMVAIAWQAWVVIQQNEDAQSNVPPALSIRVSPPKFEPAYGPASAPVREADGRSAALPMDSIPRPATGSLNVNHEPSNAKLASAPAQPSVRSQPAARGQVTGLQHNPPNRNSQVAVQQVQPQVPVQHADRAQAAPVARAPIPAQPAAAVATRPVQAPHAASRAAAQPPVAKNDNVLATGLSDPLSKPANQQVAPAPVPAPVPAPATAAAPQ